MSKLNKHEYSLLEIVQDLHMFTTGAYNCNIEKAFDMAYEIKNRLNNWHTSYKYSDYDSLVYDLCQLTLKQFLDKFKKD